MSLPTVTQLVDDKLRSVALGDLALPAVRDRAIGQALLQYSVDAPQQLQVDEVVMGDTLDAPEGWVPGRSSLVDVEYPIGAVPRSTIEAAAVRSGSGWTIVLQQALGGVAVRVTFTAPHAGDASTVPAEHENAIACWAAAELCRQLATQKGHERDATINAAAVNGQSQSGDLARRAKDWLAMYRTTLGLADPDKTQGGAAAGAVVEFEREHRRGRFSSLMG